MTDAKRIFEKYKSGEEEVKTREAALQAEVQGYLAHQKQPPPSRTTIGSYV